ncbi:hypothetical protein GLYMA_20G046401v4 [Glycine max]|nr:hypothetical protein GLYMA_20G046401v4 [Glycine max]KAH1034520.1 hypothetical protein GYH30_054795 [Glycine max]
MKKKVNHQLDNALNIYKFIRNKSPEKSMVDSSFSKFLWLHSKPDLLSDSLLKSMYVSFLAGCFQSVRFGLEEAHGKGQALQFNWLYEKGAFVWDSEGTISVDFTKIEGAIESLSREILTIQAKGDKENAGLLLQKYCVG